MVASEGLKKGHHDLVSNEEQGKCARALFSDGVKNFDQKCHGDQEQ